MKLIRGTLATVAGFALATSAFGGPNQGGIVIAHVSEGLVYTDDSTGYCGQSTLEDCKDADARIDGTDVAIFHILAAFGGTPRFSGTTIGIDYDPEEIILVDWGVCGDFELPTEAWPEPGTGVAVTWAEAQLTRVTEIYWFAAYSYTGSPSEFVIGPHPHRGIEPFFADDDIPSNLDVAIDTGTLGFNMDGYQPCAPERACAIELSPANITAYKPCGGTIPIDLNVIDANFLELDSHFDNPVKLTDQTGYLFEVYLVDQRDGRWYAITNPGWPALLAVGLKLGHPGLVNPLLAALSILLLHALVRRLRGLASAHAITAMLAVSPWFLFLSASFMTHLATLACLLGAWLAIEVARRRAMLALCLLAGLLLGEIFLVRPLDGILAGGNLWAASSRGLLYRISTGEGSAQQYADLESAVSLAPVVADNMLYILDDSGRIHAYR